jgi:hypothetical protein
MIYKVKVRLFDAKRAIFQLYHCENKLSLRSKNNDGMTKNQDNVSELSDTSTCRMLLESDSTIEII